jgi:Vitamin K epoxide reductase family
MNLSRPFIVVAALGIFGAFYHAWTEGAFSTNYAVVSFSPYASLFGVPYWLFGVVWFPLIFVVALRTTGSGKVGLNREMLALLTVGNVFTGYLWYLDLVVVNAFTVVYALLYATNYALTALVVADNWSSDLMHGYAYGTITGALVGLLFGPYGVAACGIGGGIFGALRNYAMPARASSGTLRGPPK